MRESEEVEKRGREKVLYARLEPERHARIKSMISAAGGTQDKFVLDAVLEKLERTGIATTDVGLGRELSREDYERIEDLADLLRAFGDSEYPLLRVAVDNQIKLLYAIVGQR